MTEIYVKVETGQDKFDLETGHMLKASLTEEAENNRANTELVERLSDILDTNVGLIEGHKRPRKKLKVKLTEDELEEKVEQWQKQR
ncbi:MAG: DUF167 family protein [Candidatus Nanohaloarchaea archaeon]